MITAVSQKPDLAAMKSKELGDGWLNGDDWGFTGTDGIWTGGDNINLGIATTSIGQAGKAADAIHAHLQGTDLPKETNGEMIRADKLKVDWYEPIDRTQRKVKSPEDRLANPFDEVDFGVTDDDALIESSRCFSCGKCFAGQFLQHQEDGALRRLQEVLGRVSQRLHRG